MAKLSEGISIQQLIDGGAEFEVSIKEAEDYEEYNSEDENIQETLLKFNNMNCLQDENGYNEGEPFEIIAKEMIDLIPDGGVKKKVLREGYGELPPDLAVVKVDYNAYVEYEATPFDSTYSRRKKHEFILNNAEVIPGLDIGVQSMKITEKAQFLLTPQYAYGVLGCLGRVPKNTSVLFEVELHEIVDSGAALSYNQLSEDNKQQFQQVYNYCLAICARAKDKFQKNINDALKEYNTAMYKLENVELKDYHEQEKQQDLLLRLYTNILVCYTRLDKPKKGCIAANKIYEIAKGIRMKIPAKVYFSNAKCLRMLGEFAQAKRKLEIARSLEPRNPDIANEFILLKEDIEKHKKTESSMAKAFVVKS
ncbi:hypothetical protein WA026_006642 [Henosepilachna vigintioctopunctata]|uniref:peptidylprolyl isomerase n=1 Tax=Henosepilachna vigintioctopunctata TaxID=420089 RepID=A0AAW1UGA0_9CUCU